MSKLAQSTILFGNNIDELINRARELAREMGGQGILIEHQDKGDKTKEIRQLYRFSRGIQKKPLMFIIDTDSFFVTVTNDPWQNAFLKLFEEPGPNIYFVLATTTIQKLLPTIKSRGQIISHRTADAERQVSDWLNISVYDRLKAVAKTKNRGEGMDLVRSIVHVATRDPRYAASLPLISDTLDRLSQNGNVKLQLTNLAVNLR